MDTTHREAVGTVVRVRIQLTCAIEVHVAGVDASRRHRRRPVVAVGALIVGSSSTVVAVARSRQA